LQLVSSCCLSHSDLLFSSLKEPECLSLISYTTCSTLLSWWYSPWLALVSQLLSCTAGPKVDTDLQLQFSKCRTEEKNQMSQSSDYTTANIGPYAVRFLCKDTLLTCPTSPPGDQFLLVKLFSTELALSLYYYILHIELCHWALKYYCDKDKQISAPT